MNPLLLVGAITMYVAADSAPLYWDRPTAPLIAGQVTEPWVAIPVEMYSQGWECGDYIYLDFDNGSYMWARAWDAGPLTPYCVIQPDGACLPIVTDVPQRWAPFSGLSTTGRALNISAMGRKRRYQYPDTGHKGDTHELDRAHVVGRSG